MGKHHDQRLIPLEALRGVAALIVLVHHFFLGFSPFTTGLLDVARDAHSIIGSPIFVFFNGTAAVSFFFTLSGFVLCWSLLRNPQPGKITQAIIKRLPRLACLVTLSTLISCALFKFDLYFFNKAAKVSASPWLAEFGYAGWTPAFEPSYLAALFQGVTTFVTGEVTYNSNLWTMQPEFLGSMIVFVMVYWCVVSQNSYQFVGMGLVAIFSLIYLRNLFPFVMGSMLCVKLLRKPIDSRLWVSGLGIFVGLYMLGYMIDTGWYAWIHYFQGVWKERAQLLLHTSGSLMILFFVMTNNSIFQRLNGKLCQWLGRLSFPLYLVHGLVIYSISSYFYLQFFVNSGSVNWVLIGTFLITIICSVLASLPLSLVDEWWVRQVNHIVRRHWTLHGTD